MHYVGVPSRQGAGVGSISSEYSVCTRHVLIEQLQREQAALPPCCLGNLTGPVGELLQPEYGTWRVATAALQDQDRVGLHKETRQF